jgi:iron complex transport system ATP-binding protein
VSITAQRAPLRCFDVEVAAVTRLSPHFLRVSFRGDDLRDFGDGLGGPSSGTTGDVYTADLRIKLVIPADPGRAPQEIDVSPGWYPRWRALPPAERGEMRTYTVRRTRLDGPDPQVDVDFVLHLDDAGRGGAAATWASRARVGDRLLVLGPTAGVPGYGGIAWRPPTPEPGGDPVRVLVIGDETAVPAIGSILEGLPQGYVGHALLEVPTADDVLPVASRSGLEVGWLPREGARHGTLLTEAVKRLVPGAGGARAGFELPDIDVDTELLWEVPEEVTGARRLSGDHPVPDYVWVAGEAAMVRDIRRHLVHEAGLARRTVSFMGYWRRGRPESV